MRKLLWYWTAGGVVLAGGLVWFGQHGYHHPESCPGRFLTGCSHARALLSPTSGIVPVLAEKVRHDDLPSGSENRPECRDEYCLPPDPVAIPDCPVPVSGSSMLYDYERIGTRLDGPDSGAPKPKTVIQVDENAPPAVVIHEEEMIEYAKPLQATIDYSLQVIGSRGESILVPEICPSSMPYCLEEKVEVLPLPAEDTVETLTVMPQCDTEISPYDYEGVGKRLDGPDENDPVRNLGPGMFNGCSRQPSSVICPHTGRSYPEPQCPNPAGHAPTNKATPGSEEENEPLRLKKKQPPRLDNQRFFQGARGLDCPAHPEVDTMEYRASDGNLHDYGPNPL